MNRILFKSLVIISFIATIAVFLTFMSCKSHSIRDMRIKRGEIVPEKGISTKIRDMKVPKTDYTINPNPKSKSTSVPRDIITKPLFMQSEYANIELPPREDGKDGPNIVSEQVTFRNEEKITTTKPDTEDKIDLSKEQQLSEVVVKGTSRFSPERNGLISVDFIVKVPKGSLSPDWRVYMQPLLLHNDSVVTLQSVVLKGRNFYNQQKEDYKNYEEYLKSIVNKSAYDSVFLDKEGIRQDISDRQAFFYDQYYKEWSELINYDKWKSSVTGLSFAQRARLRGSRDRLFNEYSRKANEQTVRAFALGRDTTGIYAANMKEYNDKIQRLVQVEMGNEEKLKHVPPQFKEYIESGVDINSIINGVVTKQDSVRIANFRYQFEQIAINEMKDEVKEEMFKELVPYPYETNARVDSVVESTTDYTYYYKQDYPVSVGLKNVRIYMNSTVDAIDKSKYTMPRSDTLAYFISSLSQLVDTSYIFKRTTLYRDLYNQMVIYPKFAVNKTAFNINYKDNSKQLEDVIKAYDIFREKSDIAIDSIMIRVSTDLEGDYDNNYNYSKKRAEAIKDYLAKTLKGNNLQDLIKIRYKGEDWNTLVDLIKENAEIVNKDSILSRLANAVYPDDCEKRIKKDFPADYKIIYEKIYPQLAKADIVFNMHRTNITDEVTVDVQERPGYEEALKYMVDREYKKAFDILADYPDYNTALCLVCMGYNAKALELLKQLPQTGNTEYLLAILAVRAEDDNAAIEHLRKAVEMDPTKEYRIPLDPEMSNLVKKHNLNFSNF